MKNKFSASWIFLPAGVAAMMCAQNTEASEIPETPQSDIGYSSPEAALKILRQKPGVAIREENNWIVITDRSENTIWSISAAAHPAHPTAVKRTFVERNGAVYADMKIMCGATKDACDQVVRQFEALNEKLSHALVRKPN
jgi:hypothetical protein